MNLLEYKGYEGQMEWDEEANQFYGEVVNLKRDVVTFVGRTLAEAEQAFRDSVDDYLKFCEMQANGYQNQS